MSIETEPRMSEPTIGSVLREFNLDLCEGGAACDEVECVGSRKIAGEVIRLRTALILATQRAEAAEAELQHVAEELARCGAANPEADTLADAAAEVASAVIGLRIELNALRTDSDRSLCAAKALKFILARYADDAGEPLETMPPLAHVLAEILIGIDPVGSPWLAELDCRDAALAVQPTPLTETNT